MAEFLLLGHIPGTSIYITFSAWLAVLSALVGSYIMWRLLFAKRQLWFGMVYLSLAIHLRYLRLHRPAGL